MPRSWYAPLVVVLWCVATGWLVVAKILPTFRSRPPATLAALHSVDGGHPPVAWSVRWDDRPIGTAVSQARLDPGGRLSVESLLDLRRVPVAGVVPRWLTSLADGGLPKDFSVSLRARGSLALDDRGRLESFRTTIHLPDVTETIVAEGTVAEGTLRVAIRAGGFGYETSRPLPDSLLIADELAPHASLPGLEVGQRWTAPVYNPLRSGPAAVEILQVVVERETMLYADDRAVTARLVTFRDDSAPGLPPRLSLWVDREGRVLRQEANFAGATIAFLRRSDADAELLARELTGDSDVPPPGAPP